MKKKVVVLMNLGSPNSTSVADVKKYLDEFLMDERVIDKKKWFRWLLVKGIIVPFRSPKSAEAYNKIWTDEGSPLIVYTEKLAQALSNNQTAVYYMMRYGDPSPKETFKSILAENNGVDRVLLVPLYPHYAMSSFETAVAYAYQEWNELKTSINLDCLAPYFDHSKYIDALAESIRPFMKHDYDKILFSYHGIPKRHILKSDITQKHCFKVENCCQVESEAHAYCYRHQCYETTRMVVDTLGLQSDKYEQSFQSRLGRDEWLLPYTAKRLEELPSEGVKKLLVVCPAFTSDCLETLEEISMEGREEFLHAGGEKFDQVPCLNLNDQWLQTLSQWIEDYFKSSNSIKLLSNKEIALL